MSTLAAIGTTGYDIQKAVHILGAATWFGVNISLAVATKAVINGSMDVASFYAKYSKILNMRVKSIALFVLFMTGFGLVGMSDKYFKMSDPFVSVGFATIIIGGAIGGMIHAPSSRAIEEAAAKGDKAGIKAAVDKSGLGGAIETLLVVVTIIMMAMAR